MRVRTATGQFTQQPLRSKHYAPTPRSAAPPDVRQLQRTISRLRTTVRKYRTRANDLQEQLDGVRRLPQAQHRLDPWGGRR